MSIIKAIKEFLLPFQKEQNKIVSETVKHYLSELYSGKSLKINLGSESNIENIYIKDGKLRAEIRLSSSEFLNLVNNKAAFESSDSVTLLDYLMTESEIKNTPMKKPLKMRQEL